MRTVSWLLFLLAVARAQEFEAPVVVAPVEEREVAAARTFVGSVEPSRESVVGSEVDGLVVELVAREGDEVAEGDVLARLRTRVREIELAGARADLDLRAHELEELENGSRPEEIDEAAARLEAARQEVALREWKLESAKRLIETNAITKDELKEAEIALARGLALQNAADAALRLAREGPRAERIAQAAARKEQQAAAVARLDDEIARHVIRAPFAGFVVEERTEVGQWLKVGEAVVRLATLDEVDVTVPVLEDYIAGIKVGMPVTVGIDAAPGAPVVGAVTAIIPSADRSARTFPVKVRLKNVTVDGVPMLKAGMFARVRLAVGEKRKALLVPKDAIVLGGPQPIVYVVDEEKSVVMPVPVALGIAVDAMIQVEGPLQPRQQVVVRGNERLRPGQKVRVSK